MQENKNSILFWPRRFSIAKYEDLNYGCSQRRPLAGHCFLALFFLMLLCVASRPPPQAGPAGLRPQKPDSVRIPAGDTAKSTLVALLTRNKYTLSRVGVMVKQLDRDSASVALNADSMYNPASCSKLLTAAMAFDRLGINYAFRTSVFMDGAFTRDSGICRGNLYVKGGGDPYLVIERLWLFVQHLGCIGLKTIEGDVILDGSFFDAASMGPGFDEEDSSHPYVAPTGAATANFNCVSIWERPGPAVGAPVLVDILPKSTIVKLVVTAQTIGPGRSSTCTATTRKEGENTVVMVTGGMPMDADPVVQYKKVWQTWEYFGDMLQRLFEDNKIKLKGRIKHGNVPHSVRARGAFYVFPSVPLYQVINGMMKESINYMAEMIFKTLSAESDSLPGSWERSSSLALAWWKEKNLGAVPKIKNGSGMGDSNRMSCRQIVELLGYVWGQKTYLPEYLYSLPVAGTDGTLKSRFRNSRLKGIVRAKTGTLNEYGVHTMAGYAFIKNRTFAFAIVFNNCAGQKLMGPFEMQEKILEMVLPEK